MGKAGSICRASLATSQPSILPTRLISVTSARYLPLFPFNTVTFFAGRRDGRFKTAIDQGVFNDELNRRGGLNNQEKKVGFQKPTPPLPTPKSLRRRPGFGPGPTYKNRTKSSA